MHKTTLNKRCVSLNRLSWSFFKGLKKTQLSNFRHLALNNSIYRNVQRRVGGRGCKKDRWGCAIQRGGPSIHLRTLRDQTRRTGGSREAQLLPSRRLQNLCRNHWNPGYPCLAALVLSFLNYNYLVDLVNKILSK